MASNHLQMADSFGFRFGGKHGVAAVEIGRSRNFGEIDRSSPDQVRCPPPHASFFFAKATAGDLKGTDDNGREIMNAGTCMPIGEDGFTRLGDG